MSIQAVAWALERQNDEGRRVAPCGPQCACGSPTLTGDFSDTVPGAYLPARHSSGTAANRAACKYGDRTDAMDEPPPQASTTVVLLVSAFNAEFQPVDICGEKAGPA